MSCKLPWRKFNFLYRWLLSVWNLFSGVLVFLSSFGCFFCLTFLNPVSRGLFSIKFHGYIDGTILYKKSFSFACFSLNFYRLSILKSSLLEMLPLLMLFPITSGILTFDLLSPQKSSMGNYNCFVLISLPFRLFSSLWYFAIVFLCFASGAECPQEIFLCFFFSQGTIISGHIVFFNWSYDAYSSYYFPILFQSVEPFVCAYLLFVIVFLSIHDSFVLVCIIFWQFHWSRFFQKRNQIWKFFYWASLSFVFSIERTNILGQN